ncbi:MAG: ABC transporter permease [Oscillospiraceae bacterium]|nr:ABC transporter permease [Oscillospiraceae bacterium]
MKNLKRLLTWYALLNKRLFRRAGFIIVLLIIPVLVLGISLAAKEESGILNIGLYLKDESDPTAKEIAEALLSEESLFRYTVYDSEDRAVSAVRSGAVDAAWVFEEDMGEKISAYTAGTMEECAVTVYEQEENVVLQLAREKLFGFLYSRVSYSIFKDFIAEIDPEGEPSEEELIRDYNTLEVTAPMVQFAYMSGEQATVDEQADYLTAPLRGIMALMVVLCAMMSCAYYVHDEEEGCFVWLSDRARVVSAYGYCLTAVIDMAVIVIVSLWAAGMLTGLGTEIVLMLIYCLAAVAFANIIRRLCGTIERLGLAMPIVMIALLVLCPVFLNMKKARAVQFFIPTFHYLHGLYNRDHALYLAILTVILYAVDLALAWVIKKRKRV